MKIIRIAPSSNRFTRGKIYDVISEEGHTIKIIDDNGKQTSPCIRGARLKHGQYKMCWKVLDSEEFEFRAEDIKRQIQNNFNVPKHLTGRQRSKSLEYRYGRPAYVIDEDIKTKYIKQEKMKMLKIEDYTTVDGINVKDLTVGNLIHYVKVEESKIKALDEIKSESKAIARLKKAHESNIVRLIKFLDDME